MSNQEQSSTKDERKWPWRKRVWLRESLIQTFARDAAKNFRTESEQMEFIVEEYYKRQGER
jgi:hypothetical protein